jgi:hypothetical protein
MVHVDETGKATFRFRHRTEGPVYLVGDFCRWQTDHLPMRPAEGFGWVLMLRLPPGTYEFRYLADGRWHTDYAAFGVAPNAFGGWNGVVRVPKVQAARAPRVVLPGVARRRLARSA